MKVLVISDSHLKNDWTTLRINYDLVIHAGDHQMSHEWMIKNTDYFVDGNNDWGGKNIETFEIEGVKFVLVHGDEQHVKNHQGVNDELKELALKNKAHIVIFGHTHIPLLKKINGVYYLNPGSIGKPRNTMNQKTYAEITIEDGSIKNIIIKEL